jgi:urea transporter
MARGLYPKGKESLLDGTIVPSADDIRVALIRTFSYDAADEFLADLTSGGMTIVARSAALSGKSVTNGIFDAADLAPAWAAVGAGSSCNAVVLYEYNASDASAQLLAYADDYTNLPITPNGGDINVTWDNGASKVFAL